MTVVPSVTHISSTALATYSRFYVKTIKPSRRRQAMLDNASMLPHRLREQGKKVGFVISLENTTLEDQPAWLTTTLQDAGTALPD